MFQRHNTKEKTNAAMAYIVTGSAAKAAKMVGIPDQTIRNWMTTDWWDTAIDYARRNKMGELHGELTGIIHTAVEKVKERLDKGDEVIDGRTGKVNYKAVSAKDAATIAALFMDKREVVQRILIPTETKGQLGSLVDMKKEFEDDSVH